MKLSICNELFATLPFEKQCDAIAAEGFEGVEIAPFTIDCEPYAFSAKTGAMCKTAMQNSGIAFAGMHWLMTKPEGLHITSENASKRTEAIEHIKRLLDFAGNLGGGCLIFGSPKGRNAVQPVTAQQAELYFIEALHTLAPFAKAASSVICIEALDKTQSNIINTLSDARRITQTINNAGVSSMFDFHNTADETQTWQTLVVEFSDIISHVHINRMDGTWPIMQELADFAPALKTLRSSHYKGWISLEIFTLPQDPIQVLRETRHFIEQALK